MSSDVSISWVSSVLFEDFSLSFLRGSFAPAGAFLREEVGVLFLLVLDRDLRLGLSESFFTEWNDAFVSSSSSSVLLSGDTRRVLRPGFLGCLSVVPSPPAVSLLRDFLLRLLLESDFLPRLRFEDSLPTLLSLRGTEGFLSSLVPRERVLFNDRPLTRTFSSKSPLLDLSMLASDDVVRLGRLKCFESSFSDPDFFELFLLFLEDSKFSTNGM